MVDFSEMLRKDRERKARIAAAPDKSVLDKDGYPDASKMIARAKAAGEPRPNSPEDLGVHRNQDGRKGSTALRMTLGPDEEFERIAREAISQADKVKCGMDEYITGLRYIIGEVEIALQAAKETS